MHLAAKCLLVISECDIGWCVLLAKDREHRHLTLMSLHIMSECDDVWCVLAAGDTHERFHESCEQIMA